VTAAGTTLQVDAGSASVHSELIAGDTGTEAGAEEGGAVDREVPELHFVRPLPGFPGLTRFALVRLDEGADDEDCAVFELRSLEVPDVRFLVGIPTAFFPDYAFDLDDAATADLALEAADDALVLVVLTVGADSASTTANLLAPVVVNGRTRSAAQVILSGSAWPVRAAVV
jgi:flagellar assembly factor FliW